MNKAGLSRVKPLHTMGMDLIVLHGKVPTEKSWLRKERKAWEELEPALTANGANVGVRTGRELEGYYHAVIDVDVVVQLEDHEQQACDAAVAELLAGQGAPQVRSGYGNGSRHLHVLTRRPARKRLLAKGERKVKYHKAGKERQGPCWKVEIMGQGGQVVLPPSVHPDTQSVYTWEVPCAPGSLPLVDLKGGAEPVEEPEDQPGLETKLVGPALVRSLPIAAHFKDLVLAGDCSGYPSRSEGLFAGLIVLARDTRLSNQQVVELLLHPEVGLGLKAREKGEGAAGWLRTQVLEARRRLEQQVQAQAAEPPKVDDQEGPLKELLQRCSLVLTGGKPAVFWQRLVPDELLGRDEVMTLAGLKQLYLNKPVKIGARNVNPADLWACHPERREYLEGARMVCPPRECPQGVYNLWQGWGEPVWEKPVSDRMVALWREFVLKLIAAGNAEHAAWIHAWCADLFQDPGNPKGVALVLRSGEGTGKGTFCELLGAICGAHYRHVSQESQLTGRFNAHFAESVLVNANEMVWAADKRGHGQLYAMVTDQVLMLERKNFDAVPMRNCNHFVVSSNLDWVVPAGIDARRWFVLDVAEVWKQQAQLFEPLRQWAFGGQGLSKLLRWYLDYKPEPDIDLRKPPVTEGLVDQKIAGFDSLQVWWHQVLDRGSVVEPIGDSPPQWEEQLSKQRMYQSYQQHCHDARTRPVGYVRFFRRMKGLLPGLEEVRLREGKDRPQGVRLPLIEQAREVMERALRG